MKLSLTVAITKLTICFHLLLESRLLHL